MQRLNRGQIIPIGKANKQRQPEFPTFRDKKTENQPTKHNKHYKILKLFFEKF